MAFKKVLLPFLAALCVLMGAVFYNLQRPPYAPDHAAPKENYAALLGALKRDDLAKVKSLCTAHGFNSLKPYLTTQPPLTGKNLAGALGRQKMPFDYIPVARGKDYYSFGNGKWNGPRSVSGQRNWKMRFVLSKRGWFFDNVEFDFPRQDLMASLSQ